MTIQHSAVYITRLSYHKNTLNKKTLKEKRDVNLKWAKIVKATSKGKSKEKLKGKIERKTERKTEIQKMIKLFSFCQAALIVQFLFYFELFA